VTYSLLPRPQVGEGLEGSLTLTSPLRIAYDEQWGEVVDVFAADMAASIGWAVQRVERDEPSDIRMDTDATRRDEHYTLRVTNQVVIAASSAAGFAYALTSLRQLGPAALWSRETTPLECWMVPGVSIVDGPAFAWRGAHLDVARRFFDVEVVLRFIDLLAAHRLNRLHLHLNDDQGWRVEVPGWPRLTEVGAWRLATPLGHEREGRSDDIPHGGFYRAADIARIVEHARRRHVVVVPEIDLPGHAQAVLAAYPHFGNTTETLDVWTHWGVSDHVLNVQPETLAFVEDVVRYVASLFPGNPVHIGGDECPTDEWSASPAARAVMHAFDFVEPEQLQALYTQRLAAALVRDGHEVLAWDEVLDAVVPPGTTICAWRSVDKGIHAAQRGLDVIMAPMQYLYFDWLSSDAPDEPTAVKRFPLVTTWEKVYGYHVIPDDLDPTVSHRIRGAQVQLWSEYIATRERLDYMAFPRLCAFSEVVWGSASDVVEFRGRLEEHLERLDALGVSYRHLDSAVAT